MQILISPNILIFRRKLISIIWNKLVELNSIFFVLFAQSLIHFLKLQLKIVWAEFVYVKFIRKCKNNFSLTQVFWTFYTYNSTITRTTADNNLAGYYRIYNSIDDNVTSFVYMTRTIQEIP